MYLGRSQNEEKIFSTEKPFSGYGFSISLTLGSAVAFINAINNPLAENPIEDAMSYVDVTCSLLHQYREGKHERPFTAVKIVDLLELAQHAEGIISVSMEEKDGSEGVVIRGYLPLTESGSKSFLEDETSLLTVITGENIIAEVWTIESPTLAGSWTQWTKKDVLDGQTQKQFEVSQFHTVAIPMVALTKSTEITITFTNGGVVRYKKPELQFIGLLANDCSYNVNGRVFGGFGKFAILDVSAVSTIDIHRESTSPFSIYMLDDVPVKNMRSVAQHNSGMIDVASLKVEAEAQKQLARN